MSGKFFAFALTLPWLTSCGNHMQTEISEEIARQFEASKNSPIHLATVGPLAWQCVLPPYSTNKATAETLGFEWDAEAETSIGVNDGINVLVFIKAEEVIAYTEHPRNQGDFSKLEPKCLDRENSTVVRQVNGSGWVYLASS